MELGGAQSWGQTPGALSELTHPLRSLHLHHSPDKDGLSNTPGTALILSTLRSVFPPMEYNSRPLSSHRPQI